MKVAVEGCCHGQLDAIYNRIEQLERQNNYRVELLLICGDFQAMRTQADLSCMAVPPKYLEMGDFPKYYTGEKVAPIFTVVIGGNHEASNYMRELHHGGFLAPNIYYLGSAGVVRFNGLRIAGASGIYKPNDYNLGFYETLPFDQSSMRSIYHVRHYDVQKLLNISPPDVFLSHDWPQYIERHGDLRDLFRRKPHFRTDSETGKLGSPPLFELLNTLKSHWWFSGHMHVRYAVEYRHGGGGAKPAATNANPDEIEISMDDDDDDVGGDAVPAASSSATGGKAPASTSPAPRDVTRFLALDKCLPRHDFLEVIDIDAPETHDPPKFTFDTEWLGICHAMHPYLSTTRKPIALPPPERLKSSIEASIQWVKDNVGEDKDITSVQTFYMTSPGPVPGFKGKQFPRPAWYTNPQTLAFCEMLGIENKFTPPPSAGSSSSSRAPPQPPQSDPKGWPTPS